MDKSQTANKTLNTFEFGNLNHVRAESVRTRYWLTGSYHGVVPEKLASGRLSWPAIRVLKEGA